MKLWHRFWLILCIAGAVAHGVEPGGSVVVVYNKRVPESKGVAEHYAERRQVPAAQVIGLDLPTTETMTRAQYREQLQTPLYKLLVEKKLFVPNPVQPKANGPAPVPLTAAKIRYAVLCYGVPLKISADPTLVEEGADKLKPELRRNEAAVDNELALLPVFARKMPLAGPLGNPFYGATNAGGMQPTNGLLMVARLDGPNASIARGLVDKAMQAETNGLWGRAYFDARGLTNGDYKISDDWMRSGAQVCQRLGFETFLDETPSTFPTAFPMSHVAIYAGWYDNNVSGPFTLPGVEFMPGAFAYHLHSFNAATLRTTNTHWTGPLLARGATITFGSVEEPYLSGTPDVATFLHRLIFLRFSFGEAAYAAQGALSWQTTVIGDPLYRPFLRAPDALHFDLEKRGDPLLEWSHLRVVNLNQATGLKTEELIGYLEEIPLVLKNSAVLLEKLGDLRRSLKKMPEALLAYEQALKQSPSPQQKIRLMLMLAELLSQSDREKDAYALYEKFLVEVPRYPAPLNIYQKLLPLAQRVGDKASVEKYQAEIKRLTPAP